MTDPAQDHREQMDMLASLARPLLAVDLEPLRQQIAKAEAVGPILYPTEFRDGGGDRLVDQRRFLDALADFQQVCASIRKGAAR